MGTQSSSFDSEASHGSSMNAAYGHMGREALNVGWEKRIGPKR